MYVCVYVDISSGSSPSVQPLKANTLCPTYICSSSTAASLHSQERKHRRLFFFQPSPEQSANNFCFKRDEGNKKNLSLVTAVLFILKLSRCITMHICGALACLLAVSITLRYSYKPADLEKHQCRDYYGLCSSCLLTTSHSFAVKQN